MCSQCKVASWSKQRGGAGSGEVWCAPCTANPQRVKRCVVCMEPSLLVRPLCCKAKGIEQGCCATCFKQCVNARINEGCMIPRCPIPECKEALTVKTLWRLAPFQLAALKVMRAERRTTGMLEMFEAQPDLATWALQGNTQMCPQCFTLVERTRGCRHMTCRCGAEFCYACGNTYPCSNGEGGQPCENGSTPRLPVNQQMLDERRHARAIAFLMGSHPRLGKESSVKLLPTELHRAILAKA